MKRQDIAVLLFIVFFAGIFSFFLSKQFITRGAGQEQAETVTPISSDFPLPDTSVFNMDAFNPTVRIEIAPNTNPRPFED